MGWARGSDVMLEVVKAIKENVHSKDVRTKIYRPIYDALCDMDWDTQDECLGHDEALDVVISEDINPNNWKVTIVKKKPNGDDSAEVSDIFITKEDAKAIAQSYNYENGRNPANKAVATPVHIHILDILRG